jgi:23S rRNA (uracil1939-C5)-methyltransferase
MKKGDEIELALDRCAFEGKSVGRVNGLVVLVVGGVTGDVVRARVSRVRKQYAEACIVDVLTPSPLRSDPRCRYFGTCGGCVWQHVSYKAQLDFKRQHVIDALERIGGFREIAVLPTIGSEETYFYRNKMEFSFGDRWLTKAEMDLSKHVARNPESSFALGLHIPQRFDKVLDIEECWLQSETSTAILNTVRGFCKERGLSIYSTTTHSGYLRNLVIRESRRTGELMVNLVTSEERLDVVTSLAGLLLDRVPSITTIVNNITQRKSQVAVGEREILVHGSGYITERIGKRSYRISANSFFQTNTEQAEALYDVVQRMADLNANDVVFDLYCGTGTIALHIADEVAGVVGIESVPAAIEDACRNAEFNNVRNCTFILGDLKEKLTKNAEWLSSRLTPRVVITDPPRSGMHEKVVVELRRLAPERIIYVSCNPATQARDLKLLTAGGLYAVHGVQPVDMFPHTYHIENVVSLARSTPS